MLRRKVVVLGSPSVGKTSLVNRWVRGIFSEKYLHTIGVRIEKKCLVLEDGQEVTLLIWDLAGAQELKSYTVAYLRGAHGCLLVADGTRRSTFEDALRLLRQAEEELGKVPYVLVLNKQDQEETWEISVKDLDRLNELGVLVFKTSAKTGNGVDEAFRQLAQETLRDVKKTA